MAHRQQHQQQSARAAASYTDDNDDTQTEQASSRTQVRSSSSSSRQPHYAAPTTSTVLPEYANAEAEAIRQSFSTGNYRLIAHLPNDLKTHHVSEATASRIDDNLTSALFVAPHGSVRRIGAKGGNDALFSTFDYVPDEYARASQLLTEERKLQEERRLQVNPLPWLGSTHRPLLTNALAGRLALPAPGEDPFDSAHEAARREAFLSNQGLLHGPFVPSQASKSIGDDRPIKLMLPELLSKLLRALDSDWADARFQIYVDEEGLVMIQFEEESIDNPKGLQSYMNMFVNTSQVVSEYGLSKLVELWGHTAPSADSTDGSDGHGGAQHIYFALRPPWVKRRAHESFFALHPEMSAPGGTFNKAAALGPGSSREEQKQLASGTEAAPLMLTAGSSGSGSHARGGQQQQALGAAAPASSTSGGIGQQQPRASSAARAAEEREISNRLMASFDAGLQPQPRRPPATGQQQQAAGAPWPPSQRR